MSTTGQYCAARATYISTSVPSLHNLPPSNMKAPLCFGSLYIFCLLCRSNAFLYQSPNCCTFSRPVSKEKFPGDGDYEEEVLGFAMDSFLRGEYDRPLSPDAPAPRPGLSAATSIDLALRAFRNLDDPTPCHGAAVLQRFCLPLDRIERWGDTARAMNPWKAVLRGSLNPEMLARKVRESEFSGLLYWTSLDVTDGAYSAETDLIGVPTIAVVSAALHFGAGTEPVIIVFTLRRLGGVWLIDSATKSQADLFTSSAET